MVQLKKGVMFRFPFGSPRRVRRPLKAIRFTRPRFRTSPARLRRARAARRFPMPVFPVMRARSGFTARGFTGIEVKFYDQKLLNAVITTSSTAAGGEHDPSATVLMNTVTQGDGESQRDGRRITMKSIYVVGNVRSDIQASQSAADNPCLIFVALVMDLQTNGATIESENVFINPGGSGVTAADPFRNLQFTRRFKILATRKLQLHNTSMTNNTGSAGGIVQAGVIKRFKMFVNLNTVVNYTGTTETVANIADNSLHLIAWATETSLVPLLSYHSRLRYVG